MGNVNASRSLLSAFKVDFCFQVSSVTDSKLRQDVEQISIIFSQNHRNVEAGRHLWRLPSLSSCSKMSQLEQVSQDCVPSGFKYLQKWRHHNITEKPVWVFN